MPVFGLVCQTQSAEIRYRTITRTRLMALHAVDRRRALRALYEENVSRLERAIRYCESHTIRLYRLPTGLFPFMDHEIGEPVIQSDALREALRAIGRLAARFGTRIVCHPDQFVVLNSERPEVVENSTRVLRAQALVLDLLGLPRNPWSAITLHGGKAGRGPELVAAIARLDAPVRKRLVLENDERAYGAAEILDICRTAAVPMVFDAHHHLVKERLSSYDDPSISQYTRAAAKTWEPPSIQIVHISNGAGSLHDVRHSDTIAQLPAAFKNVPYVEVEAKAKETAVFALRRSV